MLRELTKSGIASALHFSGLDRLIGDRKGLRRLPLIISYHRVVQDFEKSAQTAIAPLLVSTETLEKQIDWIGKHYDIVSLDEIAGQIDENCATRDRLAAITFDDGYADVYHNAFPLLKSKGLPSAVFVVTDLVGTRRVQLHDEIYLLFTELCRSDADTSQQFLRRMGEEGYPESLRNRLRDSQGEPFKLTRNCIEALSHAEISRVVEMLRGMVTPDPDDLADYYAMDWDMLKEMKANGVTVGSHTKSHTLLGNTTREKALAELVASREILEEKLGVQTHHLAYPDGSFNQQALEAVAESGYRAAFTTCTHRSSKYPQFTIPRRVMWENSSRGSFSAVSKPILSCQANGVFDPANACERAHA